MAQWSTRRKSKYALGALIAIIVIVVVPAYIFLYTPPTCSDGIFNQDETGVDCGGSCPRICSTSYVPPQVNWARADQIGEGLYNLGAYVQNVNLLGGVRKASYIFSIFDREGHLIGERKGTMSIPPHKNVVAFEKGVSTNKSVPFKVTFAFTEDLAWEAAKPTDDTLVVVDRQFSSDETGSFLQAAIENRSLAAVKNIQVQAVLYDGNGNVTGFSQSVIDVINRQSKEYVAFTWRAYGKRDVASSEIIPIVTPQYGK